MKDIEEQMLEERLANWGRWARDPKRKGRSAIAKLAELVPDEDKAPCEREEHLPPVNVLDALTVQRAWSTLPQSPERIRVAKVVVGCAYVFSGNYHEMRVFMAKMHRVRIRDREFNDALDLGKKLMRNAISRIELAYNSKNQ